MAAVNKVILLGNLGADPETRYMPNGDAVTTIRLATTETWKDRNSGEKRENTEWHRVVFFRKLAEIVAQYLKKGSSLYVEGRIRTRKWTDNDGQDRYTTEIEGQEMQMLGGRRDRDDSAQGGGGDYAQPAGKPWKPKGGSFDDLDDDIPFITCSAAHDGNGGLAKRTRRYA